MTNRPISDMAKLEKRKEKMGKKKIISCALLLSTSRSLEW
jgi:hypothetical protein